MSDLLFGYWGKMKKVSGKFKIVWVGPMTKAQMKYGYPDYRHNFKLDK